VVATYLGTAQAVSWSDCEKHEIQLVGVPVEDEIGDSLECKSER
jgi:hypothetical protein